jgi:hypothetical protein
MNAGINGILPNDDPYGNGQYAGSFPATVVDWIEVELRNTLDKYGTYTILPAEQ